MEANYWAGKNSTKLQDIPEEPTPLQVIAGTRYAGSTTYDATVHAMKVPQEVGYAQGTWISEVLEEGLHRIREVLAEELQAHREQVALALQATSHPRTSPGEASSLESPLVQGVMPTRVLAIEEHPLFSEALRMLFQPEQEFELVGHAVNPSAALALIAKARPDIVLLAIELPDNAELDLVTQINRILPEVKTVVITDHQGSAYLERALRTGVYAFINSRVTGAAMLSMLQAVKRGERLLTQPEMLNTLLVDYGQLLRERERTHCGLTDQEIQILRLAAAGLNNKDIGAQQFWSEITIKRKMQDIYRKLDVRSRAQAVAEAIRLGII